MEHHGLQEVSWPGFLILMIVIGSANALSFWRLAQCCQLTGEQTYMGIARKAFGARWAKLWQLPGSQVSWDPGLAKAKKNPKDKS
jgi:hypothetical protein